MARKKSKPKKSVKQSTVVQPTESESRQPEEDVGESSSDIESVHRRSERLKEKTSRAESENETSMTSEIESGQPKDDVGESFSKMESAHRRSERLKGKTSGAESKNEDSITSETDQLPLTYKCCNQNCLDLKPFSSASGLNQHIRIKHEGLRWICPFCQEEQSSKYSHERHIYRRHSKKFKGDLDQNQYELAHRVKMTEKAKDSVLTMLVEKFESQRKLIAELKLKLKAALTKIAKLERNSIVEPNSDGKIYNYDLLKLKKVCTYCSSNICRSHGRSRRRSNH